LTHEEEFIVEPLWNETTMTTSDAAAAADDDDAGVRHVVYRRSAVKAASTHTVDHCGLRGLYYILLMLH